MKIENKHITIALIFLMVFVVLANVFLMKEGNQCLKEPLTYGAKKYSKSNSADFSCFCSLAIANSPRITVNKEGFNIERDPYGFNSGVPNFTFSVPS